MPNSEQLKFKIGLSGTHWGRIPEYSILVDGVEYSRGSADEQQFVEFEASIIEGEHTLQIRLENKTDQDTLENEDKTAILKDMLLNIHSVEIDDIDLGHLIWTLSEFVGDDASKPVLKKCVNLGWNGTYSLKFSSPFYLWLLESL